MGANHADGIRGLQTCLETDANAETGLWPWRRGGPRGQQRAACVSLANRREISWRLLRIGGATWGILDDRRGLFVNRVRTRIPLRSPEMTESLRKTGGSAAQSALMATARLRFSA